MSDSVIGHWNIGLFFEVNDTLLTESYRDLNPSSDYIFDFEGENIVIDKVQ